MRKVGYCQMEGTSKTLSLRISNKTWEKIKYLREQNPSIKSNAQIVEVAIDYYFQPYLDTFYSEIKVSISAALKFNLNLIEVDRFTDYLFDLIEVSSMQNGDSTLTACQNFVQVILNEVTVNSQKVDSNRLVYIRIAEKLKSHYYLSDAQFVEVIKIIEQQLGEQMMKK